MKHTRKILSLLLTLSLLFTLAPPALASEALGDDLAAETTVLHRGVELAEGVFWSNAYSDLRRENYIVYEPSRTVTPIVTYGDSIVSRTSVAAAASALEAQGYRVVAGINGDYYDTANGIPLGSVIAAGELRTAVSSYYAVGFCADGTAVLGAPALKLTAESEHGSFSIAALNQVRYSYGGIYLYSDEFNARASTGTNAAGYDLVCSVADGRLSIGETLTLTVEELRESAVDTAVPEGGYVLTANLLARDGALSSLGALSVGDTLTITVSAADDKWNDVDYAVGALYQLVENGKVCAGLEAGAAPRTAIGQRRDGSLVFYTIDGRSSGHSIGATLTQTAERLVELGCVTALSLDGGGSTTLSVTLPHERAATVYNEPSGALRAVTNHIFLVASNEPSGRLGHIALRTEGTAALAGASVAVTAAAVDTSYLPLAASVELTASGGTLTRAEDDPASFSLLTPEESGTLTLTARLNGKRATAQLAVVETPDSLALWSSGALDALRVAPGQTVALEARAYRGHLPLIAQNDCFTWSVEGGIGTVDENGLFTAANHVAYGTLTIQAGEASVSVPVYVSADPFVLLDDFEGEQTVFTANTEKSFVRFGAASARWDYAAEQLPEGVGEAVLTAAQAYLLPTGYSELSLWVYGDGSGALLSLLTAEAQSADADSEPLITETAPAALDFVGWQQLRFPLPASAETVTGFALRPVDSASGTLYLDQLTASRGNTAADTTAPAITLALSEDGAALTGKVFDTVDGGSLPTLRVTLDGKALAYTFDHQTGALHAALPAADGGIHRVTLVAGDANGNLARASLTRLPETVTAAFPDTDGHAANVAVSYLKSLGVTRGDDLGNFNPESAITRQEFAVLLARYLAPDESLAATALPFADSASIADWARDGVAMMYALGVTKGTPDWTGKLYFNPSASISRQEALTMLGRLLELGYSVSAQSFTDSAAVADWARTHIDVLCSVGALSAYADGSIRPAQAITRAEVAQLLFALR